MAKYPSAVQEIFIRDLLSVVEGQPELHLIYKTDNLLAYLPLTAMFRLVVSASEETLTAASELLASITHCFKAAMYACPLKEPEDLYNETRSIWEMSKMGGIEPDAPVPELAAEWLQQKYVEIITAEKGHECVR